MTNIIEQADIQALAKDLVNYDAIIIGAGYAGSVVARELAERGGRKVAIIEQRGHIGGNAYDCLDDAGVLIHAYGPHIFHSNSKRAWDYLSRFTAWRHYEHEVLADINGTYTPVPFNFNSIELHFSPEEATQLKQALLATYTEGTKVPIIELRQAADPLLSKLADFVYENVFLFYTQKQWGQTPEQIDPAVTARVPVLVGRDNRYFTDTYQGMPQDGYTAMFANMLDHPLIDAYTGIDARGLLQFVPGADGNYNQVLIGGTPFAGTIICTGQLDYLAAECYGLLPYRTLDFVFKTLEQKHVLPCGTVNYTVSEPYTRITEFTWLTGQDLPCTTIMEEYSRAFEGTPGEIPYYAIMNDENNAHYQRYLDLFAGIEGFYALGRLAEYRYFNMDQIVDRALELADRILQ